MKEKVHVIVLVAVLIFGSVGLIFADYIKLKDGTIIEGELTGLAEGKYTIKIGDFIKKINK